MSLRSFCWSFFRPHKVAVAGFLLCSAILGLHGLINAYLTKTIIDRLNALQDDFLLLKQLAWPAVLLVLNFEQNNLCWRAIDLINLKKAPVIKNGLIRSAFDYVHSHSYDFFQTHLSGSVAHNITLLADNVEKATSYIFVRLMRGGVQFLVALVMMAFINPVFSFSLLVWGLLFVGVSLFFAKRIRSLANENAASQSQVSGRIVDSVTNFSNVKIFARRLFEIGRLERSLNTMKGKFQAKEWFLVQFHFWQGFSVTCLMGAIAFFLLQLRVRGLVTLGDFAFILGAALCVAENVWGMTEQIDQLNDAWGKSHQAFWALFKRHEVRDKEDAGSIEVTRGEISFENVVFHYREGEPLFEGLTLSLKPGEKVGLVGYSGGGKSTFINLILRLYDPVSGRVVIDGQDIRETTQHSLHAAVGVIPQDPSLFHRSILENIRYGCLEASDDEVVEAAKRAGVDDFVRELASGYDSVVGERGMRLSGGQRQRIAIARVILKNPPILILDEATSHLDSVTESQVKRSILALMEGRTTVVIAHRLSTVVEMDRLLIFDKGRIVEEGTHSELLERVGEYHKLWEAQFVPQWGDLTSVPS